MITLKVIWNDQIRRVGFEPVSNGSFASLQAKLVDLLNLKGKSFTIRCGDASTMQLVDSDATLNPVIDAMTKTSPWPILRVLVEETNSQPTTVLDSLVQHKPNQEKEANNKPHTQQAAEVTCDTCSTCSVILGSAYYKCLNCLNVVLCEACEEKNGHSGHLLVKLRCAVSSLPLKYQMVFLDHIVDPQERQIARNQKLVLRECCEKEMAEKKVAQAKKRQDEKEARQKERLQAKELKREQQQQQRLKEAEEAKKKAIISEQKKEKKQSSNEKVVVAAAAAKKKRATKQLVISKKKPSSSEPQAPAQVMVIATEEVSTSPTHDETVSDGATSTTNEPAITEESQLQLSDFHVIPDAVAPVVNVVSNDEPVSEAVVIASNDSATSSVPDVEPEPIVSVASEPLATTDAVVATSPPQAAVSDRKPNPFVQNLERLAEMGFTDKEKNIRLLVKHVGDLDATVEELLRTKTSWFW